MPPDDEGASPLKLGAIMFASFVGFGLVPLMSMWQESVCVYMYVCIYICVCVCVEQVQGENST